MADIKKINKEWGGKFIESLNASDAAIVFALGVTKSGKTRVCMTTDLSAPELVEKLKGVIAQLGG